MRLLNILPIQNINNGDRARLITHAKLVRDFLEVVFRDNQISDLFVSHIQPSIDERESNKIKVGMRIRKEEIWSVVEAGLVHEREVRLRSFSCRYLSFGWDNDTWMCVKHSDKVPAACDGILIQDISEQLVTTDWYDN